MFIWLRISTKFQRIKWSFPLWYLFCDTYLHFFPMIFRYIFSFEKFHITIFQVNVFGVLENPVDIFNWHIFQMSLKVRLLIEIGIHLIINLWEVFDLFMQNIQYYVCPQNEFRFNRISLDKWVVSMAIWNTVHFIVRANNIIHNILSLWPHEPSCTQAHFNYIFFDSS